jgi:hypothetical protein
MRFFLDTEFIERGPQYPVTLISIGIVSETGRRMYAVSSEFSEEDCNEWVKANVLPHLNVWGDRSTLKVIAEYTKQFVEAVSEGGKPEFWGYYCDYDWVVFAQMFGTMMDLPKGWPMYCRDIKQLADSLGNPKLPEQTSTEHNALDDALWNKKVYEFLTKEKTCD